MITLRLTIATALLGLLSIQGAAAGDAGKVSQQKVVKYADLDLSAAAGAQTLYMRLRSAAKRVCAPADGRALDQHMRYRACVDESMANAVAAVNQPALTDVYLAQDGRAALLRTHVARNP
jgi:UrcA family protein